MPGSQSEQGCRIIRSDILTQLPDHSFIATHLHVLAGQNKCDPDQRVEPVNSQCQKSQSLDDMIEPADVVLLVQDDILLLLLTQVIG